MCVFINMDTQIDLLATAYFIQTSFLDFIHTCSDSRLALLLYGEGIHVAFAFSPLQQGLRLEVIEALTYLGC